MYEMLIVEPCPLAPLEGERPREPCFGRRTFFNGLLERYPSAQTVLPIFRLAQCVRDGNYPHVIASYEEENNVRETSRQTETHR